MEGQDLGNDVVFAVNRQDARLAGTTSRVQELWSFTVTWRAGRIDRVIGRNDIDEAVLPPSASQRSGADKSQERWTIFLLYARVALGAGDDPAVHIAARVAAQARPSEVLVSGTVTDLVAGSGIAFESREEQQLKGVPGAWELFAATG